MLSDGRSYNVYVDPFRVATKKIWEDLQDYELHGERPESYDVVKTRVQQM